MSNKNSKVDNLQLNNVKQLTFKKKFQFTRQIADQFHSFYIFIFRFFFFLFGSIKALLNRTKFQKLMKD